MKKLTIEQLVLKSYDDIYKAANSVCKSDGNELVPLLNIRTIIDKIDIDDSGDADLKKFVTSYKKTLETLYSTCQQTAFNLGAKSVSLVYFKACIEVLKESFSDSLK